MQLISHLKKGKVQSGKHREYGSAEVEIKQATGLFKGFKQGEKVPVWMSHGDNVSEVPEGAILTATSTTCPVAGYQWQKFHGVQFHPEVHHTPIGEKLLSNFLFEVAGLKAGWKTDDFLKVKSVEIKSLVGDDEVIGAVSGGVDSTILAVLLGKVLGKKFHPFLIDNGLLRHEEAKEVLKGLKSFNINLKVIDASSLFLKRLKGITEPEQKRKIIGKTFIEVFEKEIKKYKSAKFLAQGTLYPDVIESVSVRGPSHTIKTHHNVGGLPKNMKFKLVEPFRELFKDEVRQLGRILGVPENWVNRHPFPGPGLSLRVIGEVTPKKLDLLKKVDRIFIEELRAQNLYQEIWQAFAVILPVLSVGVMGDARTYESVVALRAVTSRDGMTADWYHFDKASMTKISNRIINEVKGVNRVVYDVTSKPPATIEWE
jgi:GMP synthase (glutamine-hydrolysing)